MLRPSPHLLSTSGRSSHSIIRRKTPFLWLPSSTISSRVPSPALVSLSRSFATQPPARTSKLSSPSVPTSLLPSPSQIYVLPFQKSAEAILPRMEFGARVQSILPTMSRSLWQMVWTGLKFALSMMYPQRFPSKAIKLVNLRAVYVPAFATSFNIEAKTSSGKSLSLTSKQCFFPGTSAMPFAHLNLANEIISLPPDLPLYNSERHLNQFDTNITPVPFDISPLALPSILASASFIELGDLGTITKPRKDVAWSRLEAVPVYIPFYAGKFTIENEEGEYSILSDASSPTGDQCSVHFTYVQPGSSQDSGSNRSLAKARFKDKAIVPEAEDGKSGLFDFTLHPNTEPISQPGKRTTISPASTLSRLLEGWLEQEGTRELLRKVSREGTGGKTVGRFGKW